MAFEIIRNDITLVSADAIVNSANPEVFVGRGVDRAIYDAAGPQELRDARRKIGPLMPGEAAVTPAFGLDAKYIIHTVGPVWRDGKAKEAELLADCYRNSLALAKELGCESIAFPLISTGTYRFPKDLALQVAVSEIRAFLDENEMDVTMVVHDDRTFEISQSVANDIRECILAADLDLGEARYSLRDSLAEEDLSEDLCFEKAAPAANIAPAAYIAPVPETGSLKESGSLEEMLSKKEETFQEHMFRLIDRKGLEDTEVYKKANIDRKLFSKIRSNPDYNPSKKTAVALAVGMGLNLDETKDLLLRAGIALSRSSIFDIIIEYCLENGITDIFEINNILFKFEQPILGG